MATLLEEILYRNGLFARVHHALSQLRQLLFAVYEPSGTWRSCQAVATSDLRKEARTVRPSDYSAPGCEWIGSRRNGAIRLARG